MKMVNSLLLTAAAGLVAVSGAQAADLPVKAKPVEYVKVCSLYGVGFYYIPGTDICMKLGGYVRFQQNFGATDITGGPFAGVGGLNTRISSEDQSYRVRWLLQHDTRQQTAYGTLRTYMILGFSQDSGTDADITTTRGAGATGSTRPARLSNSQASPSARQRRTSTSSRRRQWPTTRVLPHRPIPATRAMWLLLTPLNSATAYRAQSRSNRNVLAASSISVPRLSAARLEQLRRLLRLGRCSTGSRTSSVTFASIKPGVLLRSQSLRITAGLPTTAPAPLAA